MNTISLTIPMDYNALTRASDMLHGLALDLNREGGGPKPETVPTTATAPDAQALTTSATPDNIADPEPDAASVFGGPKPETVPTTATAPAGPGETSTEVTVDATTGSGQAGQPVENTETTPAGNGVDLAPSVNTGALIPWDSRIHASSKSKLAKKPHGWKMKRGVSDELVDRVEAELIAAMNATPANPVEPTPAPAPPPASEPTPAPAAAAPAPAATPAAPAGAVTTFPALMQRITAGGIAQADVTAAVNKAGLQSLPLLAARPDLIPTVAAELGFGG